MRIKGWKLWAVGPETPQGELRSPVRVREEDGERCKSAEGCGGLR